MKKFHTLVILLAAIISSCAENAPSQIEIERPPYDGPTLDEVRAEFQSERAAWKRQGITHYRYTMRDIDGTPRELIPYTVTVYFGKPKLTAIDGTPVSIMDPEAVENLRIEAKTIDQHFKYIEDWIEWWDEGFDSPRVIKYNKQYHYPEYFGLIYFDKEWYHLPIFKITEFERLQ